MEDKNGCQLQAGLWVKILEGQACEDHMNRALPSYPVAPVVSVLVEWVSLETPSQKRAASSFIFTLASTGRCIFTCQESLWQCGRNLPPARHEN